MPHPLCPDDPRPFEAELKERQKRLGPDHPDVAESCSNLAILYNQQGDSAKAQPLYERALAIYEKNYGPDHPEVAHTLTDLAVLHLEGVGVGWRRVPARCVFAGWLLLFVHCFGAVGRLGGGGALAMASACAF